MTLMFGTRMVSVAPLSNVPMRGSTAFVLKIFDLAICGIGKHRTGELGTLGITRSSRAPSSFGQ